MTKVTVEGLGRTGIIWEGEMSAIPSKGDLVCVNQDQAAVEVVAVFYDLEGNDVLIRVR